MTSVPEQKGSQYQYNNAKQVAEPDAADEAHRRSVPCFA